MKASTRWPLQPLLDITRPASLGDFANRVGVDVRTVTRWALDGIPDRAADHAAVACDLLPCLVWDEQQAIHPDRDLVNTG